MLLGGAVAGQGAIDIYLLIAIAWFAAWLGDTTSFFIGRRLGREFVMRHGPRVGITPRAVRTGRGLLRPPRRQDDLHRPLRSASCAPSRRSSPAARACATAPSSPTASSAPGSGPALHILIGYFFSRSIETGGRVRRQGRLPARHADRRSSSARSSCCPPLPGRGEPRARRCAGWRATRGDRAGSSSLGRRFQPAAALPLGPGHARRTFGLEFTTLMAALAVALFVLIAYIVDRSAATPGRPRAT